MKCKVGMITKAQILCSDIIVVRPCLGRLNVIIEMGTVRKMCGMA